MTQNERLDFLINHLISEDNRYSNIVIPKDSEEKFNLFRSLVNVREPKQISNEFIKLQDDYLQERLTEINITDAYDLQAISNKLYLWQGDITTLKCGAIVNAANSVLPTLRKRQSMRMMIPHMTSILIVFTINNSIASFSFGTNNIFTIK